MPANYPWFGRKWPRKPSDSSEVIFLVSPSCAEARGRGKGRGLDGDCIFLEQGVKLGVSVVIEKRGIEVYGKGKKERKKERRGLGDKIRRKTCVRLDLPLDFAEWHYIAAEATEFEEDLKIGMVVCNAYALRKGFSLRKGHIRRDKLNNITQRDFLCSKEGFPLFKDLCDDNMVAKLTTRIGCKALIRFSVNQGVWKISHVNSIHNHELAKPEERQFLRSGRKIHDAHVGVISSMVDASIKPSQSYCYLAEEVGGAENVGFTKKDCQNFLYRKKSETMEGGDAQNESTESFVWLFKTFLESMGNKQPKTIFTDEDQAMANAIEQVFTGTRHRLCTWHIAHNATKNISNLYANPEFRTHFNKVFGGCQSVPEFEAAWDSMTNTFSANMKSTQRVESTNNVFHQMCTKTTSIIEFVLHYEKKLEDMRLTELQEDFCCKQAEAYTNKIFKFFEIEYMSCLTVRLREVSNEEGVTIYEATEEGHKRVNTIEFISHTSMVSCSCKMYEAKGILCRHALRVFDSKYLTSIPTQYVLKRWTKTVKEGMLLSSDLDDSSPQGNLKSAQSLRLSQLMHKGNSLFSLASMSDWGAHVVSEKLSEAMKLVEKDIKAKKASDKVKKKNSLSTSGVQDDDQHILDPPTVRAKGVTNKRLKSALEKSKKVAKVRYTSQMSPPNTIVSVWLLDN
ncbi:unnamed protein product [Malus baccata var. baccata]